MELKNNEYTISKELIEEILEALGNNWFSNCGESNNDDVIQAEARLKLEILKQEPEAKDSGDTFYYIAIANPNS